MSFQAYLDTIERTTGRTPRQLLEEANERGLTTPPVSASSIIQWLKVDYSLGRGHAMAMLHVIKNGPTIAEKHVGTDGTHRDESAELWLDGMESKPS